MNDKPMGTLDRMRAKGKRYLDERGVTVEEYHLARRRLALRLAIIGGSLWIVGIAMWIVLQVLISRGVLK